MKKCPHCVQGYVQETGFTVCNHCNGSGAVRRLVRRCESIHADHGWRCGHIAGHHGKHTALIPTGYPWDGTCHSHPGAMRDENGCRSCQLGWPANNAPND